MKGPKRNNAVGVKGRSGRRGYDFECIVNRSIEIVREDLKTDGKVLKPKEKFNAALELVKKALPNNIKMNSKLEIMFHEIFKNEIPDTTQETGEDNTE